VGHHWVSSDDNTGGLGGMAASEPSGTFLIPASSAREHHDRLMAWWLAFAADGMVEIVAKLPSALRPELRACIGDAELGVDRKRIIITPFPLTEHSYKQVGLNFNSLSYSIYLLCLLEF
jgi:hypothetical protein